MMHTTKHGAGFVHSTYPDNGAPTHRAQAPNGETIGTYRTKGAAKAAITRWQAGAKAPTLFTPNRKENDSSAGRWMLWKHSAGVFSITPDGERFPGDVVPADCGLGCKCGAYVHPLTPRGKELMQTAQPWEAVEDSIAQMRGGK